MTQEERDAIMIRAYETLDRLANFETEGCAPRSPTETEPESSELPPYEGVTNMDRWRRAAEEREQRITAAKQQRAERARIARHNEQVTYDQATHDQLTALVSAEREFVAQVMAGVVAKIKNDLLDEINKQVGELRAEFITAKAGDKVLDMPAFLARRA